MSLLRKLPVFLGLAFSLFGEIRPVRAEVRLGLFVGNNIGLPGEEPLRFAERDAERMRNVMVRLGSIEPDRALLVQGQRKDEVANQIQRLHGRVSELRHAGRAVSLYFYFSGHADEQTMHLGRDRLGRAQLLQEISQIPADLKIVVIDSCRSTPTARAKGLAPGPAFDLKTYALDRVTGTVVIASTRRGEPAQESDRLGGAIFTHYFVSALMGSGDVDQDRQVTLQEAYEFAYRRTVRQSATARAPVQHPSFSMDLKGSGRMILTRLERAAATLVIPAGEEAQYLVYLRPDDRVLAELVASPREATHLAVPAGSYLVQRRLGTAFGVAEVDLPFGGTRTLSSDAFRRIAYEEVALRGGRIQLRRAIVELGYLGRGERQGQTWIWRQGVAMNGAYRFDSVTVGLNTELSLGGWEQPRFETSERELVVTGSVLRHFPLGLVTLSIGGGGRYVLLSQRRVSTLDRQRLARAGLSLNLAESRNVSGVGGAGLGVAAFSVGHGFHLAVRMDGGVVAIPTEDDGGTRWQAVMSFSGAVLLGKNL